MFGFSGNKSAEQRRSEAAAEARVKRAHAVWDNADLSKRTSLLGKVIDTLVDERVFLAYVHAPWSRIPYDDRMKLTKQVMNDDENAWHARKAGEIAAGAFSAEHFNLLFSEKSLAVNWTSNDALGVWYSFGRFCFLISIGSIEELTKNETDNIIELGQATLLTKWKMSRPVFYRFERFNDDKLMSVYTTYLSVNNADTFRAFFSFVVNEILGHDLSFTPEDVSASHAVHILKGQLIEMDPFLVTKFSSMFTQLREGVTDYVRRFWNNF